ncbi:MAG: creatininase family protein [Candidatus Thermoplasmatota archaeon]|nr:creatininase family protein [Candidatus Thermoplasmatota archaeon]
MPTKRSRRTILLEELTSAEFARLVKRRPLAILPFGAVEEHGSHLPLCTDAFQAEEVARRVATELGAILCPAIRYGECRSTRNFPGTITLTSETVRSLTFEIVSELGRNGIDKILIITGHAGSGHMAALRLGAFRAVEKMPRLKVMVLSDFDIAYDLRGKEFPVEDGHGGEIETSRMLHVRPDLVGKFRPRGTSRPPEYMVLPDPEKYIPTGIYGDTSYASAAKGGRIDDYVVKRLCELARKNFKMGR